MTEPILNDLTVERARQLVREDDCRKHGHSWTVIESMMRPLRIVCDCGQSYAIADTSTEEPS